MSDEESLTIITTHAFVIHRGDESRGCGHMEDDCGLGREVRCGYYRKFHAGAQAQGPVRGDCPHDSMSGDEGPVALLGRMPVRWRCDACEAVVYDDVNQAQGEQQ